MSLALFNLGGEEILLVLLLLTLFFGAERIPQLARQLGRWKADFERAKARAEEEMRTPEERELDAQLMFERAREHQMAQQDADAVRLRAAAAELGIDTAGLSADEVRAAIAARVQG